MTLFSNATDTYTAAINVNHTLSGPLRQIRRINEVLSLERALHGIHSAGRPSRSISRLGNLFYHFTRDAFGIVFLITPSLVNIHEVRQLVREIASEP